MAQKTPHYAHVVMVKGIPQYAFTSRWAALHWANMVEEANELDFHEIKIADKRVSIERLRLVEPNDEMPQPTCLKM